MYLHFTKYSIYKGKYIANTSRFVKIYVYIIIYFFQLFSAIFSTIHFKNNSIVELKVHVFYLVVSIWKRYDTLVLNKLFFVPFVFHLDL